MSYSAYNGVLEPESFRLFLEPEPFRLFLESFLSVITIFSRSGVPASAMGSIPMRVCYFSRSGVEVHLMSSIETGDVGFLAGEALIEIVGDSSILGPRPKITLSTKL